MEAFGKITQFSLLLTPLNKLPLSFRTKKKKKKKENTNKHRGCRKTWD